MLSRISNWFKTSPIKAVFVLVVVLVAVGLGVMFLVNDSQPKPPARPVAAAPKAAVPAAKASDDAPTQTATLPAPSYLEQTSDLREISRLQSEVDKQQLLVQLAKLLSERMELPGDPRYVAPAQPQVVVAPAPTAGAPATTTAGMENQASATFEPSMVTAKPAVSERVLAVYGLGAALTARLMTAQGTLQTVRTGDFLGAGQVERISKNGVVVREGGVTRTIRLED